ncbi:MAG: hypothetical protein JO263_03500 [Candidatus Eremiobacteraeota bacterium]|nr:hypothetical protein [Candidatus Eremiobacteraeota bacterium]
MRDNIFHTIEGLRVNDLLITQGTSTLTKMSQDAVTGSRASKLNLQRRGSGNAVANSALEMDNFHLSQTVNAIAKNLEKLDDFLSDKNRFAKTPKNDDEAALDDAKKALESIASQQRSALNILSGTMGTTALQGLLARGDNTNGALQQASQPGTSVDLQNPIVGGSEPTQTNPSNTSTTAGANSAAGANSTATTASLFARNSFGQLALATLIQQKFITASENAAVAEISPIINACH